MFTALVVWFCFGWKIMTIKFCGLWARCLELQLRLCQEGSHLFPGGLAPSMPWTPHFASSYPVFFRTCSGCTELGDAKTDLNSLFFLVIAMCSLHSKRDGKEICPGSWCHLEMRPRFSFPRSATAQIAQHSGFRLLNQPAFTHFTQKLFKPEEKWIRENPMFSYHLSICLLDLR